MLSKEERNTPELPAEFDKDVDLIFIIDCVSDILFHITSACEKMIENWLQIVKNETKSD